MQPTHRNIGPDNLIASFKKFQKSIFEKQKSHFEKLAIGQKPVGLLGSCVDSRVDPNFLASVDLGVHLLPRRIANHVAPYEVADPDQKAAIAFAVQQLRINYIVIKGHRSCGGVDALLHKTGDPDMDSWANFVLSNNPKLKEIQNSKLPPEQLEVQMMRMNVLQSVQNLKSYPSVKEALSENRLSLYGWEFDIKIGAMHAYDFEAQEWVSIS